MYRIKAPKGNNGYWVPILANPDIVEHYSENVVDTLHRKNLLLLGEDRYLSTLMLRTFPRRKMMYCPQAVCKTIVPDTFRVLLSQRRRWINSTIHNLYELLQVRDLCGTFCFSMQFVVFMELAGTLVLPAAIAFTLYLLIFSMIPGTVKPVIPLILLAIILGLPGILIVATCKRFSYLLWMLVYLISLPIWNFVLPGYAFLHMDDFSCTCFLFLHRHGTLTVVLQGAPLVPSWAKRRARTTGTRRASLTRRMCVELSPSITPRSHVFADCHEALGRI